MKKLLSLLMALSLVLSLTACGGNSQPDSTEPEEAPPTVEEPVQTTQPDPEPEPELVIPDPVVYSGSGDDVVVLDPFEGPYVFAISGNAEAHHFAVTAYDEDGDYLDLLANTTDPYQGTVIEDTFSTSTLEVKATGDWEIIQFSLYSLQALRTGMTAEGSGDEVFFVDATDAKTATISGNKKKHHFAVKSYGWDRDNLMVNTTDPYEGTVMLKGDPFLFVVTATGDWSITLE